MTHDLVSVAKVDGGYVDSDDEDSDDEDTGQKTSNSKVSTSRKLGPYYESSVFLPTSKKNETPSPTLQPFWASFLTGSESGPCSESSNPMREMIATRKNVAVLNGMKTHRGAEISDPNDILSALASLKT